MPQHLGSFSVGEQVVFIARFRNAARDLTAPATLAFKISRP